MVRLPRDQFKIIEAGQEHPLVAEALRSRKHFEICWCGSGRKYKKCHQLREQEAPLPLGQALQEQAEIFWRVRGCMHPLASKGICQGKVVDSHTIQRRGPLLQIVDAENHVCHLDTSTNGIVLKEVGWKRASVFPGYCTKHDSEIFGVLERGPFIGTHEQCVLQAYRSVCNELYRKRALIDSLHYQRDVLDRGLNIDEQISRQLSVFQNIQGQTKSKEELEKLWRMFEGAVARREYERFLSKCYFFNGDLYVTSSGTLHTEFDFQGVKLSDMWDLNVEAQMLTHSIMSTDNGGAIVFTWLAEEKAPADVIASFDLVPNGDRGDIFVQYCFLNCENTYFSRAWWDQLGYNRQQQLQRYAAALFYEGGAFVPNHDPLVDWSFLS